MIRNYWLLPVVAALVLVITLIAREPPSDVSGTGYSQTEARKTLNAIAKSPRPVGSEGHRQAKEWLISRLRSLGLEVQTQKGTGVRQANFDGRRHGAVSISPYENIIALLPGRDRTLPAVLAMAHYDSVPFSYGASDDAAGVASVLEAARILSAGKQPLRDTIFLLTDAEELGLIGAQEFFDRHPLAKRVGIAVNAEARGSRGRAVMFQTSAGNSEMIDLWARTAMAPVGNSLANAVYQRMPNDTDLSVPLAKGIMGINAAYIDGLHDYHMPTDTVPHIDPASMQHLGAFVVTTVGALVHARNLPARAVSDSAYFDVFGVAVVRYPLAWGWLLILIALGGLAYTVVKERMRAKSLFLQTGAAVLCLLAIAASCHLLGYALYGHGLVAFRDRINEMDLALWMFLALCAGMLMVLRPGRGLAIGATIVTLLLAIATQIWLPGANWLFAWPAVFGAGLAVIGARFGQNSKSLLWSSAAITVFAGALLMVNCVDLYMSMAPESPLPIALLALFLPMLAAPLIQIFPLSRPVGFALLAGAAGLALWFFANASFSPRYPMTADLFHHGSGKRHWWTTSSDETHLPDGPLVKMNPRGFETLQWMGVPAETVAEEMPVILQAASQNRREVRIGSASAPRNLSVMLKSDVPLGNVRINGRPVRLIKGKPIRISWRSQTADAEILVDFDDSPSGKITLDYLYALPGLPSGAPLPEGIPTDWAHFNATRSFSGTRTVAW